MGADVRDTIADRALLRRAIEISRPDNGSWLQLEHAGDLVWAGFHGTGLYQVLVDLSGPRYRCTCPTPTQPCKHALALHLIARDQPGSLIEAPPPAWVGGLLGRDDAPSPTVRSAQAPSTARVERRFDEIDRGVAELDRWLTDQVRTGIAGLPGRTTDIEAMARRLVDAKAKGLARAVKGLVDVPATAGWQERTLARMGRLHLLLEAWRRRDDLDPALVCDVATLLGVSQRKDDAFAQPSVEDVWDVLGSQETYNDEQRVVTMRTWLRGRATDRYALILQSAYAHDASAAQSAGFDKTLQTGNAYAADLCFYPSAWPLRAEVRSRGQRLMGVAPASLRSLRAAHARFVDALAHQPWLWGVPVYVGGVRVERGDAGFTATDDEGGEAFLEIDESQAFTILACFGGGPCALMGEWDGERLHVVQAHSEGQA